MRALILAAGQGTRLRPLTDECPKCLVELGGQALLDLSTDALLRAGISEIGIVGGYRAEQLKSRNLILYINPKYDTTNMVYSMFCAKEVFARTEDLLIVYGDIIFEPRLVEAAMSSDAAISVVVDKNWQALWELRMEDPLADAETLKLGEGNRLLELGKKPKSHQDIQAQYIGLFRIRGDMVGKFLDAYSSLSPEQMYDGKDLSNMFMTSYLQYLIDQAWDVRAVPVESGWLEVDSTEDLASYHQCLAKDELRRFYTSPRLKTKKQDA